MELRRIKMKNCTNCGSPMDDNAAFCANCGTAAVPAAPAPEMPAPDVQPSYQAPVQPEPMAQQNTYQTNPAPTYNQNAGGYNQANQNNAYNPYVQPTQSMNVPGLVGFIFAMLGILLFLTGYGIIAGVVGLILSIIGMVQIKKSMQKGRGLALAGLIASIFDIVGGVVYLVIIAIYLSSYYWY